MVKKESVLPSISVGTSMDDIMRDVHGAIERAVEARSEYLKQEVTTMTLAQARRLLEKDLNVDQGFLDSYKEFVKKLINKVLQETQAESLAVQKTEAVIDEQDKSKETEVENSANQMPKMKRLKKKSGSEGIVGEIAKDQSDDIGTSSAEEGLKEPENDSHSDAKVGADMESLILEAALKRAPDFKAQAESLTLVGVRRLLEKDLGMEKGGLDVYKKHIRTVLDQLLNEEKEKEKLVAVTTSKKRKASAPEVKKKLNKSGKKRKPSSSEEMEENVSGEESVKTPKVRNGGNRKTTKKSVKEKVEEEDASGDDDGMDEDGGSDEDVSRSEESDDEETERKKVPKTKKPVESKPVYGKKVELFKSTIKACGITVPPSVYRKAKQAPEERREAVLIKEMEAILLKEGLTANASKDDIKAVKKRKEKLKDLEGMDTSNIIVESTGRPRRAAASANNFFAPKPSKPIDLGEEDEDEDDDEEQESDSEEDPNVELQDDDDDDDDEYVKS
ncbi:uncharacterized protein [Physcomitrium patens]|uniref:Histone chaperone domain-containing protein n=1 Tax=Physcomitrium patens TaxID=3218 RepID=A0A2K1IS89_PHYPA|nr:uncharacterized protein DDB_G0286299-like [Physcomitrium patens]XP_024359250.1 uncharacterized protein DDB_G0286299-like [Physcomitrium patens]XP_024359251.1 uncharacterized protein DDB_G0286299-like [Physcomitrium patens]XP_024359252.1 uncharacterized protein DDB_G0286299-like [Physcomitrium patens]XP_024359253.1 uncharacterized protein DDB_G0286299-like [Physcomitrium patens]PNR32134.1 hypothetical protein PHYPA_026259 [Physcomitrium patens]|eukprot:XP_024359249.1 uncharacterized protein DDB_G0286299-like [Physcomitrella patens]